MAGKNQIPWTCGFATATCLLLAAMLACGGATGSTPGSSSPPGPPAQQFTTVDVSPSDIFAVRGTQSSVNVTTGVSSGFTDPITFTASNVPDGVTVSFDPQTIPPSGTATATVSIGPGAHTGTYAITISGIAGGVEKTTMLNLTVTAEVLLTWQSSASGDVVGYNVARSTTSGAGYVQLNDVLITGTSFLDGTVESGQTYYYVATAVNASGAESVPSNEAVASVQ